MPTTFTVRVRDQTTGSPIAGAIVNVGDYDMTTGASGDATGTYPNGSYLLVTQADGYHYDRRTVELTGGSVAMRVYLLDLSIPIMYAFTFNFVDSIRSTPIQGVKVTLGGAVAYTDASGTAAFTAFPGDYPFRAEKAGYRVEEFTVGLDPTYKDWTMALIPLVLTGELDVIVLDESGLAVSGASVTVEGKTLATDGNGKAVFPYLTAGLKSIAVSAPGFLPASGSATVEAAKIRVAWIHLYTVAATSLEFLEPSGEVLEATPVAVRVRLTSVGSPVVGASVTVESTAAPAGAAIPAQTGATDASGVLSVSVVFPASGTYTLTASFPGAAGLPAASASRSLSAGSYPPAPSDNSGAALVAVAAAGAYLLLSGK